MEKLVLLLLLLVLFSGCIQSNNSIEVDGPYTVTNVVDGDTLDLNISERVRLSGINTPERGECYYQEAKDRLAELTLNKEVYIEKDISNTGKYGRLLRYIYVDDFSVNAFLVKYGYARVYDKYQNDTKRYFELKEYEKYAKNKSLGVWNC